MGQPIVTQVETPTIVASKRRTTELQSKQARLAWLMLFPTIIGIIIVALYPLGRTFYDSLTDASFGTAATHFIGMKN
jgi:trehalose/maltose transport system permease protein